ncbi:isocitrate lyase/phosphoenolpyruvate mutase family protein [Actinomadura sp. 9N215]|uniref:isocitrate lyase/phosphoenolpyruvate mutase family protein n=1 Tax=Actinomadura sp. 9N215 TaxID=3375150 RepID=UPI0037AC4C4F
MGTRPTTRLRRAVMAGGELPVALVGVHNALVSRLAERAGFDGGWASSLEVSAVHGLPDRNLLGFAEMLAASRSIAAASDLPLVVDADNGYGTVETWIRAVRDFSGSGIAGVCVEDSAFPKRNSFLGGGPRDLEDVESFAEKIAEARRATLDPDFLVIARTEALIAQEGMDAALARAVRYADAGADLVLLHTRQKDGGEALEVARRWTHPAPLVSIPTAYPHISLRALGRLGYRMAIYANQLLRATVSTLDQTLAALRSGEGLTQLERRIAPMAELLDLSEDFRRTGPPGQPADQPAQAADRPVQAADRPVQAADRPVEAAGRTGQPV